MIVMCKAGHDYERGTGGCRKCKRKRDREWIARQPKKEIPEEIKEAKLKVRRDRYKERMQDPAYAKKKSKDGYAWFKSKRKNDPAFDEARRNERKAEWQALKADPEKYAAEMEANKVRCERYRNKTLKRPVPATVTAARLLAIAEARARQEKMGIITKGAK